MCRTRPIRVGVVAFVAGCLVGSAVRAQPSFQGLGDLPGGKVSSEAFGVSADGGVVVGWSRIEDATGFGDHEAFRWSSATGMMEGLGQFSIGRIDSLATEASADGTIVVGRAIGLFGYQSFIWDATNGNGIVSLGHLPGGVNFGSRADSVSDDGSVVVGSSPSGLTSDGFTEAFRWTEQTGMVALGDLPGGFFDSRARDLSADGSVIVGRGNSDSGYEAFRWTMPNGMVALGDLPGGGFFSEARGVSANGSVVVGWGTSMLGSEAFRWLATDELMVGLGDLPGGAQASKAFAVSADGATVVGWGTSCTGVEAFIWDAVNGMRNLRDVLVTDFGLDLSGWTLREARGISADGLTVVGTGTNPDGMIEAWIAHLSPGGAGPDAPVPTPSAQRAGTRFRGGSLATQVELLAFDDQSPGDPTFRTLWRLDLSDGSVESLLQWQTQLQTPTGAAWIPYTREMMVFDFVNFDELWPMDVETGEHHRRGSMHPRPPSNFVGQCLAADPVDNFQLYSIGQFRSGMFRIAPDMESTFVAAAGGPLEIIAGLTFDAQGQMWGAEFFSGMIYRINKYTGNTDPVGLAVPGITGLDFDENGVLWAYSKTVKRLYTIDLATGGATLIGISPQTVSIDSMAFNSVPGGNGVPGDSDCDGDVDLQDYAFFTDCLSGPGMTPDPPPPTTAQACLQAFDFDGDQDVDWSDFATLQRVFTGS